MEDHDDADRWSVEPVERDRLRDSAAAAGAAFMTGTLRHPGFGVERVLPTSSVQIRVDQAWGLAQISVAAHDLHASYYGSTEPTGHPSDKWGWAVQGSLSIKNIPTGAGDSSTCRPSTPMVQQLRLPNPVPAELLDVQRFRHRRLPERRLSLVLLTASSALGGSIETTKTWGFRGGYTHNWNPNWVERHLRWLCSAELHQHGKALICANFAQIAVGRCDL